MKKTLAAVAVLGAFAGSALAADVTLYGVVDLGLHYTHADENGEKSNDWGMESGQNSGSRIGFKGTEQLADDVTVGFVLETQFDATEGKNETNFFHRESRLFVQTAYGELGFGRYGALDSTTGPYDLGGDIHATTGVADVGDTGVIFLGQNSRHNSAITYKSPNFGGLTVLAQFANGADDTENGSYSTDNNRYFALGASYDIGGLHSALVVSRTDWKKGEAYVYGEDAGKKVDDSTVVTGGVSYDFGITKAFVAGQYFDGVKASTLEKVDGEAVEGHAKGYGVTLGAKTPVIGGTLTTQVGYSDAEAVENEDVKYEAWNVGAIYEYPLSKRTKVYGAVGYQKQENKYDAAKYEYEVKGVNAGFGMVHNF